MSQNDPITEWRIRITGQHTHEWQVRENSIWVSFQGSPIQLAKESTLGYVFLDEAWRAQAGLGLEDPRLEIKSQNPETPNPFGSGATPYFLASGQSSIQNNSEVEHRWDIVGVDSAQFPNGFPDSTEGQLWKFSIFYGDHRIDPEMVVLDPNDPPIGG